MAFYPRRSCPTAPRHPRAEAGRGPWRGRPVAAADQRPAPGRLEPAHPRTRGRWSSSSRTTTPTSGRSTLPGCRSSELTELEVHGGDLAIGLDDWSELFVRVALPTRLHWLNTRRSNHRAFDHQPRRLVAAVGDRRAHLPDGGTRLRWSSRDPSARGTGARATIVASSRGSARPVARPAASDRARSSATFLSASAFHVPVRDPDGRSRWRWTWKRTYRAAGDRWHLVGRRTVADGAADHYEQSMNKPLSRRFYRFRHKRPALGFGHSADPRFTIPIGNPRSAIRGTEGRQCEGAHGSGSRPARS